MQNLPSSAQDIQDYRHTGVSQLRLCDVAFRSPMRFATNHAIAIKAKLKLLQSIIERSKKFI